MPSVSRIVLFIQAISQFLFSLESSSFRHSSYKTSHIYSVQRTHYDTTSCLCYSFVLYSFLFSFLCRFFSLLTKFPPVFRFYFPSSFHSFPFHICRLGSTKLDNSRNCNLCGISTHAIFSVYYVILAPWFDLVFSSFHASLSPFKCHLQDLLMAIILIWHSSSSNCKCILSFPCLFFPFKTSHSSCFIFV